ncbi:Clr5 domain-containing protein [Podospora aff. communis PSN243]|uniref:Clr5 domain-containing protein n=1 Tax=Podospora aff. communis PSN243 TaxID=3040156 RepID=A0AAV9G6D9_9PEZI|nr:Clr5 domain-containing protein [Podospora aff. communis PSN243]
MGAAPMHFRQQQQNSHGPGRQSGGHRRVVAIAPAPSTSSPAIPPPSNPRRSYATPADWEAHRDTITRLYYFEEMTLREVKKHMETHHDFLATEKMYKTRTKKWGLDKRPGETYARVAHMVRLARDRAAVGKRSAFAVNGHPVNWDDVKRYLERRPDLLAKIDKGQVEVGGASSGIVCRTPSPDPVKMFSVPGPLDPERDTRMHGEVLLLFRDYMDGGFDQGMWRYDTKGRCYLGDGGSRSTARICAWMSDIWTVVHQGSSRAQAVALINELMDHLGSMIKEQDCSLFVHLVRCYYFLHQWDRAVSQAIGAFIVGMCEALLGIHHPISKSWKRVVSLDGPGLQSLLEKAGLFRLEYLESLARAHGEIASSILLEEYFLARTMAAQSDAAEIDRVVGWITDYLERIDAQPSGDYCRLLLRLSAPQIFHGNFDMAEAMLRSVASWIERGETDDPYFMMVNAGYCFNLGLLCFELGQEEEANKLFAEGLKSSMALGEIQKEHKTGDSRWRLPWTRC